MTQTFRIKEGDWVIDQRTGRPQLIRDRDKLVQDLRENFEIETQLNGFGASLDDLVGYVRDPIVLRAELSQAVHNSVEAMITLQQRYHRAERPKTERLVDVVRVTTTRIGGITEAAAESVGTTTYGFRVDLLTEAGDEIAAGSIIVG